MIRKEVTIGDCRLILGDCREVLPLLPKVDAVVTDPPYGIGHRRGVARDRGKGQTKGANCLDWDSEPFSPSLLLSLQRPIICWGANWYADKLPAARWLLWDKQCGAGSGDFSEFEIAWCSTGTAIKAFRHMWLGVQRDSEHGEARLHDTQKPVALMQWCIGFLPDARTILDPFMGSGTTLVACARMGRAGIGIEIDEGYFEIACERVRKAYAQPDMFVAPPQPKAKQADIFGDAS